MDCVVTRGEAMTDAGWAERVVAKAFKAHKGPLTGYAVKVLKAEHARSVRIVKAEIKRVKLSQHNYTADEKLKCLVVLAEVLTRLERGRTKGVK